MTVEVVVWYNAFLLGFVGFMQNPTASALPERLYYLNQPESIRQSGFLGQFVSPDGLQRSRVFFHFINKTGRRQNFVLHFDKGVKDFRFGYGISSSPGGAGKEAVKQFMLDSPTDKFGGVNFSMPVNPGAVISGICEGVTASNTNVVSFFGAEKNSFKNQVVESPNVNETKNIIIENNKVFKFRIGTKRDNLISGDYGTTFHFKVTSKVSGKKLLVFVSPRGGHAALFFARGDDFISTPVIGAKQTRKLFEAPIKPGETLNFDTMLPGGYAYPLEIRLSIV